VSCRRMRRSGSRPAGSLHRSISKPGLNRVPSYLRGHSACGVRVLAIRAGEPLSMIAGRYQRSAVFRYSGSRYDANRIPQDGSGNGRSQPGLHAAALNDAHVLQKAELSPRTFCTFPGEFSSFSRQGMLTSSGPDPRHMLRIYSGDVRLWFSRLRLQTHGPRGAWLKWRSALAGHAAASTDG
jgi:hypothetical protein